MSATRWIVQQFVQVSNKKTLEGRYHCPFGRTTPREGPVMRKRFPRHEIIMFWQLPVPLMTKISSKWQLRSSVLLPFHYSVNYSAVIMSTMASQITSPTIVYSTVYSGANERKYQTSASLAFVRGIHRWPVNSPHKGPVTRKKIPFDDVIMFSDNGRMPMCQW